MPRTSCLTKGSPMTYIDGFLLPVPKNKVAAYRKMARFGAKLWKKHGALEFRECVAHDLKNSMTGGRSLFPKMVKAKRGETVVFSYIVFKSKAHRDRVNKKVMSDPSMAGMGDVDMPFDVKRMAYGGFCVLVDA